ncbi:GNAT family N-acetyltransferase [Deferrisoma camini]|uniref:GNAT family N-acetyltransferase n=1 Tax=Deferrisoma camini TaxID=1035120 RepID=UPI00046CCFD4|nr:GNAT family N-acetyltransferase [Deferrisoma camini]
MSDVSFTTRFLREDDLDAVVAIDQKVLGSSRRQYYETKFEKLFGTPDYLPVSFAAETAEGKLIGFVMAELYIGQYGISQEGATLDTIGVDPDYQKLGVGQTLINELLDHLRQLGVQKINTLVNWDDYQMIRFFSTNQFAPSRTINLEREL